MPHPSSCNANCCSLLVLDLARSEVPLLRGGAATLSTMAKIPWLKNWTLRSRLPQWKVGNILFAKYLTSGE